MVAGKVDTASDIMIHGKVIASIDAILADDDTAIGLFKGSLQPGDLAVNTPPEPPDPVVAYRPPV
jgi:hypothetical protein